MVTLWHGLGRLTVASTTVSCSSHFYSYNTDCWDVTTYPRPRFASEFGVQAWPSFITMSAVSNGTAGDWSSMNSPFMQHRQHHPDGNAQMMYQMALHFTGMPPMIFLRPHAPLL